MAQKKVTSKAKRTAKSGGHAPPAASSTARSTALKKPTYTGGATGLPGIQELLSQAQAARERGLLPVARQRLDALFKIDPENRQGLRELVLAYLASEDFERAEQVLERLVAKVPNDHWSWSALALSRNRLGKAVGETEALVRSIQLKTEEQPLRRLFELRRDAGDFSGALDIVRTLRKTRDTDDLAVAECRLLAKVGELDKALKLASVLMDRSPPLTAAAETWGAILLGDRNEPEIVEVEIKKRIQAGRNDAFLHTLLSRALHRLDKHKEAISELEKAVSLDPKNQNWWYELALQYRQFGDLESSQKNFEKAMELNPFDGTLLRVFGGEHRFERDDRFFSRINQALASIDLLPKQKQVELHYAAAKAFEDVGELDTAFDHYRSGGRKQTQLTPYKAAGVSALLKTLRTGMNPLVYENFKEPRCLTDKPVFVLGMPRSGTTLCEQIISSHPKAYGAGELKVLNRVVHGISVNGNTIQTSSDPGVIPTYIPGVDLNCAKLNFKERGERYEQSISALAKIGGKHDALRIVDKMPGNYFWVGLIPLILPNARIIHTRRHPMDTCLSNYRIFFPDGMPWSYDLRNLGKCYRSYDEHMKHWESNLPKGMMLSIRYEDVVSDFEVWSRKIISHIGLEWDEACLKFYETERSVKTASLVQVRQPLYTSSVGKWRKYERYLRPLLDEIGTLVEEYEKDLSLSAREGIARAA